MAHCLILILLFSCQTADFEHDKFFITTNSLASTIVFMPLHKRVPAQIKKSLSDTLDQSRRLISYDAYQKALEKKKKSVKTASLKKHTAIKQPVKQQIVEKIAPVKNNSTVQSPTSLRQEKVTPVEKKKVAAVTKAFKSLHQKTIDTSLDKKKLVDATPKKELVPVVKKEVRQEKAPVIVPQAVVQKSLLEKKNPIIDPVKIHESLMSAEQVESIKPQALADNNCIDEQDDDIDVDDISYVGRYDLEKHEIEGKITAEIEKHWKSPIGISKTVSCELYIVVGLDGKALSVTITKGSGMLAYDMSGKAAAYQSFFPKEVCGKEFTIVLG